MMFVWFFIIIALVYWVVKNEHITPVQKQPITKLKERLARGDISIEEYQQIKQQLEENL